MTERELFDDVSLCTPDGRLDPAAVGWSRRPLHRAALPAGWPRRKRWDYWAVMTERHLLMLLVADADYLGVALASVLDLATGARFEAAAATPFGAGIHLPDTPGGAPIHFDHLGVRIALEPTPSGTALRASARSLGGRRLQIDLLVDRAPQTLNVVVPFPAGRFQLTSKQVGMPARGRVLLDGSPLDFSNAWACLDFGRGIWPWRTAWNWAAASGLSGGCAVSLNFGGRWTDGTGTTENALWLDGRLHKLSAPLTFAPSPAGVHIHGSGVDLRFTRAQRRNVRLELGLLAAHLDWSAGRFAGVVRANDGAEAAIEGLPGWAEALDARW